MEQYLKFMISLAAGLAGLGMVLVMVMDTLLVDYDAPAAFAEWCRDLMAGRALGMYRAEDAMMEAEKAKDRGEPVRLVDQRREALRELAAVESRLQRPLHNGPIVLTPLPVPTASVAPASEA
jgi:hypothetical protein